jgi:hypothetical protein
LLKVSFSAKRSPKGFSLNRSFETFRFLVQPRATTGQFLFGINTQVSLKIGYPNQI